MLNDVKCDCPVYAACGYTDLRRGIDGLAGMVQGQFGLNPFGRALFLFCGRRKDQNEWLLEQLRLANKRRFGASSEQTKEQLDAQLSLMFNEAEAYAAPTGPKKVTQGAAGAEAVPAGHDNWVLRAAEDWLGPVYDVLHWRLVLREVLHADGYQGYHRLPEGIRVVGCWAHARRKFDEALNTLPLDKREGAAAYTGLDYCNKLFAGEEQFKELHPEERTKQRLKEEKPLLDALLAWADSITGSAAPKSALWKALYYLKEQWTYLVRYLEAGRLERSNNRAERLTPVFPKNRLPKSCPARPVPSNAMRRGNKAGLPHAAQHD